MKGRFPLAMNPQTYINQTIAGRYHIKELLGEGGMGVVYLGEDIALHRPVAVKLLHEEHLMDPIMVKRFYREANVAAALKHENIVNVLDVGETRRKEPYMALEYLVGEPLSDLLKRSAPLTVQTTLDIIEPVISALAEAHRQGIVHRDLKPGNIFLSSATQGEAVVKLIDFGISKYLDKIDRTILTMEGALLGTPTYMSPEQINNETSLDHRTDLYAVGVILYKMLTNKLPFDAKGHTKKIMAILNEPPIPPSTRLSQFPKALEPLIMKLLKKSPHQRFHNANALLTAIKLVREHSLRQKRAPIPAAQITRNTIAAGELTLLRQEGIPNRPSATVWGKGSRH